MKYTIRIRNDNPAKNKCYVYKYIERKVYDYGDMKYIHWNKHTWFVNFSCYTNGNPVYDLLTLKDF